MPKEHGYDVREYSVRTEDNFIIKLHRIIHPARANRLDAPSRVKPFLLIHGLVGSSMSFMRNIDPDYKAPDMWFDARALAKDLLEYRSDIYQTSWQSTADKYAGADSEDKSRNYKSLSFKERLFKLSKRNFARLDEIDYDADLTNFGREYKQAYRKFELSKEARKYISNSLAYTLSNFGYDVWMINLRGNKYSKDYHGPKNRHSDEYWDFNLQTVATQDLPASLKEIRKITKWRDHIGIVSYSYTCLHVLKLLTQLPTYQESLQPIVMLAPATLTSSGHEMRNQVLKKVSGAVISHNGPFPALARDQNDRMVKFVCNLPLAKKLCRVFEMFIHGQVKSVSSMLITNSRDELLKADVDCGQTSIAVLREILDNLVDSTLQSKYEVSTARQRLLAGPKKPYIEELRRTIMLVHSDGDDIANAESVHKLKASTLRFNTLIDYSIQEPTFGHVDFLFSRQNQYLVNGEVARMVSLFDLMVVEPLVNKPVSSTRGYYKQPPSRSNQ